jgi:hypothetical protein
MKEVAGLPGVSGTSAPEEGMALECSVRRRRVHPPEIRGGVVAETPTRDAIKWHGNGNVAHGTSAAMVGAWVHLFDYSI